MPGFTEISSGAQVLTPAEPFWFTPLTIQTADGMLVIDPFTTAYNNGTGPWDVTLATNLIGADGTTTATPIPVASYNTGYNFHIAAVPLANGDVALLYDTVDQGDPSTGVDLYVQNLDAAGNAVGSAVELATDVANVVQYRVAAVSGDATYDVVAETVTSGEATITSQIFDENGAAVGSTNVVDSFATVGGEGYSLKQLASSNVLPASSLYIRGSGTGAGTGNVKLKYELINGNGAAETGLTTIYPDFPTGSTSNQLLSFDDAALQTAVTQDPLFAVAMRFSYVISGVQNSVIEVDTIDAYDNSIVSALEINVPTSSSGETMLALAGGGFVVGYGGSSPNMLQAFNAAGQELGGPFVLPANETNFTLSQLPDGNIVVTFSSAVSGGGNQLKYDIYSAPVCYAAGTRILTERGEVEVERLRVGDMVVTHSGASRPIRWLGHRRIDCRRHPRPREVTPVRIAADAFGPGKPARDLFVSPGHAICVNVVEDVLIPAEALVNGATIAKVKAADIEYWHVELDSHDVVIAENLPAESYIDMDNRSFFVGNSVVDVAATPEASPRPAGHYCLPFLHSGGLVETVRRQLGARARALGWTLLRDPQADLHLVVDGARLDGDFDDGRVVFRLPEAAAEVWLVSHAACPADSQGAHDERMLGVCLAKLSVEGACNRRDVEVDDAALAVGFHKSEREGDYRWRWTTGRAHLPAALWASVGGGFDLVLHLAGDAVPRWAAPVAGHERVARQVA